MQEVNQPTTIYAINASATQLRDLVSSYPDAFPGGDAGPSLHVPPGWLAVLRLALADSVATPEKRVRIQCMGVRGGALKAEFASGSTQAQEEFQALLAQTREYCPCCGNLWPPHERKNVFMD